MKKLLSILGVTVLTTTPISYAVACGTDNELQIVFVPSNDSTEILNTVKPLEEKLETELKALAESRGATFNKDVVITTSTNYEIAGQTLQQGKADIGFLPINTYVSYRGKEQDNGQYNDLGWLLSASRSSVKPETNFEDFQTDGAFSNQKALETMTAEKSLKLAKHYNEQAKDLGSTSTQDEIDEVLLNPEITASYYRSYIYANNDKINGKLDFSNLTEANYKEEIKNLFLGEGAVKLTLGKGSTSSASVLYPLLWLKNVIGLTNEELKVVFEKRGEQLNYPDAGEKIGTGAYEVAVGFSDIRNEPGDLAKKQAGFKNSIIIGATDSILNDGIQYSRKALGSDANLVNDLRKAFINLINKEENKKIFEIYNHTGYVGPEESTSSTDYEIKQDKAMTEAASATSEIANLIKDWA